MKVLSVFSGGLDSMLAAALIRAQGIEILALFFETPFFHSARARRSALSMNLPFKAVDISSRHLEVVKKPRHGYGGNMNPCIDCHALMFRIAGEMLEEEGADFVVSGEVLGQRPLSQNKQSLAVVARDSGLGGLLLRPLSAKLLSLTLPEERGWVERESLLDLQGRSRKPQMALAEEFGISDYPAPAGGCLLTEKFFAARLRDLLKFRPDPEINEIELLRVGRHFRLSPGVKLVVGRNKRENEEIIALSKEGDSLLTSLFTPGPTVLLAGEPSPEEIEQAVAITGAYSDKADRKAVQLRVKGRGDERTFYTAASDKALFTDYLI